MVFFLRTINSDGLQVMGSVGGEELEARSFGPGITFLSMGRGEVVDWFAVFADLKKTGRSIRTISHAIGVAESTLKDWKNNGVRPKFDDGVRLVLFWSKVTNKKILPMRASDNDED